MHAVHAVYAMHVLHATHAVQAVHAVQAMYAMYVMYAASAYHKPQNRFIRFLQSRVEVLGSLEPTNRLFRVPLIPKPIVQCF